MSEQIEEQVILHCKTFTRGSGFHDLARHGQHREVKICKGNGLTINQNAQIHGENYIVVNYSKYSTLKRVWILWNAEDRFFTPRKAHLNLRTILKDFAAAKPKPDCHRPPRDGKRPRRRGTLKSGGVGTTRTALRFAVWGGILGFLIAWVLCGIDLLETALASPGYGIQAPKMLFLGVLEIVFRVLCPLSIFSPGWDAGCRAAFWVCVLLGWLGIAAVNSALYAVLGVIVAGLVIQRDKESRPTAN